MKKAIAISMVLILGLSLLAGCGGGGAKTTSSYTSDDGKTTVSLTYPDNDQYKWSTDSTNLRTSSIKAAIVAPDFNIGVSVRWYGNSNNFDELKANRSADSKDFAEATYGGIKGFSYYYDSYYTYVVSLPIEGNKSDYVELWVTPAGNDDDVSKSTFNSAAVQEILKSVQITTQ